MKYQLKHLRERIAKNLAEKGVLGTQKSNFFLFDMTIHPLLNEEVKTNLVDCVKNFFGRNWMNDPWRMDKRMLALVILANTSDVLEHAFSNLNDEEYELAMNRVNCLTEMNFEKEARREKNLEAIWAVFKSFK